MQRVSTPVKLAVVSLVIAGAALFALRYRGTPGGAAPVTSSSGFRAAYLTNGVASCISAAKTTLSGQRVAVPDEKITNYCVCTINKVSDSFTDRQIAAADQASLSGTAIPADLSAKLTAFAQECAVHLH